MARTYYLSNTASDLGGGADFSNVLATAVAGAGAIGSFNVANGTTEVSFGFTPADNPGTNGTTGDFTVEVNVTVGTADMQIAVQLHRINSAGTVQASSSTTSEQTGTAGIKTFNLTSVNLGTWASGDRLRVDYRFRGTGAHGNASITIGANTANEEVVTPFTAGGPTEFQQSVAGTLSFAAAIARAISRALTGSLSPSGDLVRSTTRTVTASVSPSGDIVRSAGHHQSGTLSLSAALATDHTPAAIATPALVVVLIQSD